MWWIERAFKAGLLDHCDALSFHYGYSGKPIESSVQRFERKLDDLRRMMNEYGEEKALWNTEASVYTTSFLDYRREEFSESDAHYHFREAAYKLTRMYAVNLANRVEKIFYYDMVLPRQDSFIEAISIDQVNTGMLEIYGGLKPIGVAYATTADILEGAKYNQRIDITPDIHVYFFTNEEEIIAVYWGNYGNRWIESEIIIPSYSTWTLSDVMNNRKILHPINGILKLPLNRSPMFIICKTTEPEEFTEAWYNAKVNQ
jgi:hypothetical protein